MAALGRPAYITLGRAADFPEGRSRDAMRARSFQVLDAAFQNGIRYFDAARSYGDAEQFVGEWLSARQLQPGEVTVGSKWGYAYTGDWKLQAEHHEVKELSVAMLCRQYQESRMILGPHLALYQVHSATMESGVLESDSVLDELARLRAGGLRIGITVSGPNQAQVVARALEVRREGQPLFSSVQATWNLLERSCEEVLRQTHEAGRTVLVKEVLANGRLTGRGSSPHPALEQATRTYGWTRDAVSIAAALAQPWVDVVLLGPATVEQLLSNLRARELALSTDVLESLKALQTAPQSYWAERAKLPWN